MIVRLRWTPVIVRIRWTPVFGSKNRDATEPHQTRFKRARPKAGLAIPGLLLALGMPLCTVADLPPVTKADHIRIPDDPAIGKLTAFMREHDFVKPYYVQDIVQSASKASISPSLIVCIEFFESSGGKHYDSGTNNPLGWNSGKTSFASVQAAFRYVAAQLGSGRYYQGKTLEQKLRLYNPNPAYLLKVMDCMTEISQQ